ncbi:anthranilate phosphoribosyltransferase [Paraliomyxa miuraensis]|uniref:anthranilate phosphoribosyltransferase n=1 Tax=Paraliomyxa miuraensis TaxID=376150 RepID=UPI002251C281|nr:anthranilate phosphoribosyltransferase [Paraliomyxa miuraensis]MCX4245757.1 anthranilate phosphoribosyltransferase [Paraliomyxa miuraensis]
MPEPSPGPASATRAGLAALAAGRTLDCAAVEAIFDELMDGQCDPSQVGALLMGLAIRGETTEQIAGAAAAMRRRVVPIEHRHREVLDTCGTGGSGIPRRNVSTAVALAVAACGVPVAKHGNRGASSQSGSADVLEALGVNIAASPAQVGRCLDEVGVGFLYAPALHPAMKHAMGPRRALGIRTLFNLLGPLTNPAGATRQLLGIFDPRRCEDVARALGALGSRRVLVVHGFRRVVRAGPDASPGIDDLSPEGESLVVEWRDGAVHTHVLTPEAAGLPRVPLSELAGGSPRDNAKALVDLVDGAPGPYRTAVQYSGALALLAAGDGELSALPEHAAAIGRVLDEGAVRRILDALVQRSHAGG